MENNTLDSSFIKEEKGYTDADLANGFRRFANSLIDTVIIYILFVIFIFLLFNSNPSSMYSDGLNYSIYLIWLAYYTIMEMTTGKTIGKFITGTRVITVDGEKPGLKTAFIRSLCRFIPFDHFSFLGSPCKGWHDTIAKSRVIYENKRDVED